MPRVHKQELRSTPAAISVAGVVREHLALAKQCVAHAQAYQKRYFDSHNQALELSVGQ